MNKIKNFDKKIISKVNLLRKRKKVVLCHGAFDLVHPGHINHLEEAKKIGDILIVTITADRFLKKHLHSPLYNENERLDFLQKLKFIDHVFVIDDETAIPAIQAFRPHFYCKGKEYKKDDNIGNLQKEKITAKKHNCEIIYIGKNVKSSSKIFAENFFELSDKNIKKNILINKNFNPVALIEKLKKLKVLVIGETIFDKYTFVKLTGISPKSNNLSYTRKSEKLMPGGALASYFFIKSFIEKTELISLTSNKLEKEIIQILKKTNIVKSKNFPLIIKERFLESNNKIFTINHYKDSHLSKADESKILSLIKSKAPKVDIIIVQDFGHNLINKKIINALEKFKNKLSINVQTNSINYGYNIIDKKYKKCMMFSLDERELKLSSAKRDPNYLFELRRLVKKFKSKHGYLTLGDRFSLLATKKEFFKVPTLNKNPKDTMGAGDIFHSLSSVLSVSNKNSFINLLLSQIAGAHAVNYLGNSMYPNLNEIIRTFNFYVQSLNKGKNR